MGSIRSRSTSLAAVGLLSLGLAASAGAPVAYDRAARPRFFGGALPTPALQQEYDPANGHHEFVFTRAAYNSGRGGRGWGWGRRSAWSTDYPKGDRQFLTLIRRLVQLDAYPDANAVRLDDPALRRFPFLYAVEVGHMALTDAEVEGLRSYLLAGGFLVVDDFWGSREWWVFEQNIRRVLPEYAIEEIPLDHPVFNSYYPIQEILQVPSINNIRRGRTWERDGRVPYCLGIFDEKGRLMVIINWNTDLGDAWEWAEQPDYPLRYSTFAYEMGANMIIYAMSH